MKAEGQRPRALKSVEVIPGPRDFLEIKRSLRMDHGSGLTVAARAIYARSSEEGPAAKP
jgi:hypothetical protein